MKSTGRIRRVDEQGRIILPKELRNTFKMIEKETRLDVSREGEFLVLSTSYRSGVSIPLHDLGSISIPKEIRETMNIKEKDDLEIFTEGDCIFLRKHSNGCNQCGDSKHVLTVGKIILCRKCMKDLVNEVNNKINFLDLESGGK
jgi:AbrB family looped-hinge helix DNA binding protein